MSNPTLTGQDEARRVLADKILHEREYAKAHGFMRSTLFLTYEDAGMIAAALRAPSLDRGAEEWNYDMDTAPKGAGNPVLVSVPAFAEGHAPFVGEAYYHEGNDQNDSDEGWWWAGTSPGDYYASPIREVNAEPIAWRHLPAPAALAQQPKGHGGGDA